MSRNLKLFLGAAAIFYVIAAMNDAPALYVLAGVSLAAVAGCYWLSRLAVAGLELRTELTRHEASAGGKVPIHLQLTNIGLISRPGPLVSLKVSNGTIAGMECRYQFLLPALLPRDGAEAQAEVDLPTRGRWAIGPARIVGTDPHVLAAIDGLVPLSGSFTHKVELGPLDANGMARLIEARHQASGYRTRYPTLGGAAASDQREAHDRFFARLAERAGGRPLIGVFEWLRSLRMDDDGQTVLAELAEALDLSYIDAVPLADLITLALVHVHAGMTPAELATVARIPPDDADETLRRLAWRHLVELGPSGYYAINPVIWPRLAQRLRTRGIA